MGRVDGDTTRLFLGSLVDLSVVGELCRALVRKHFGDGGSKGCFSVVDMTCGRVKTRRGGEKDVYQWFRCSCASLTGRILSPPPHNDV